MNFLCVLYTFFSPFFAQIDSHTFYIAMHLYEFSLFLYEFSPLFATNRMNLNAVPLKIMSDCFTQILMQYLSYNVSDCLLFHHFHQLVLSLFLRLFQSNFSHITTNYCPMYFLLIIIILCNNNKVCRGSTLKLSFLLLYLHSQHKDPILLFC